MCSAVGKPLNEPPGEYGRKAETYRNWRGSTTRGEACGLIGFNAGNLTCGDSIMKGSLKGLPEALRGGAWPPSVCAVKCPLKCGNKRDPHSYLLVFPPGKAHNMKTAEVDSEEGVGYGRSVCPKSAGLHASCNDWDNGMLPRKGMQISKTQS